MEYSDDEKARLQLALVRLHFFYIVLILVGSLVLLATQNWTKLEGFTDYLSVSATITSLVLGVLAIIYGFVSSNSTNSFLGSVESSARGMREIGSRLNDLLSTGQDLQTKAQDRNEELHSLIGNLRTTVENLSANTTNIAGTVGALPSRIDSLRDELLAKASAQNASTTAAGGDQLLQSQELQRFLSMSSIMGLAALKSLAEAKARTKPTYLETIFKSKYIDSTDYAHGFLIASSCVGIVDFELEQKPRRAVKIVMRQDVGDSINHEWNKRASSTEASERESIQKYAALIEASFEAPGPAPSVS